MVPNTTRRMARGASRQPDNNDREDIMIATLLRIAGMLVFLAGAVIAAFFIIIDKIGIQYSNISQIVHHLMQHQKILKRYNQRVDMLSSK